MFVAALRALALAVAAAPRVTVRMSRREKVFASALLGAVDDGSVRKSVLFADEPVFGDVDVGCSEVHIYGRDSTIVDIARLLLSEVRVRAHGSGLGIVVVGGGADADQAGEAIVESVVPFDQRGCLSPRVVFVGGGMQRCMDVAHALVNALERWERLVPIGDMSPEERGLITRYRDTCSIVGKFVPAGGGGVGVTDGQLWVAPVGRCVHVVGCNEGTVGGAIAPLRNAVTAVGVEGREHDCVVAAVLREFSGVRCSGAASMQRPPLDGPVDMRRSGLLTAAEVVQADGFSQGWWEIGAV